MRYLRQHLPLIALVCATLALSFVPLLESRLTLGAQWRGVPTVYMDEYIYYAYVSEVATGNLFFGNPYFLEHRFDPPLFLSGSIVLGALPLLFGLSLGAAIVAGFIVWSFAFVFLCYKLLRELSLEPVWSAGGALFAYLACFDQVYRIGVRQEVYPFLLLFYLALVRVIAAPDRWRGVLLGVAGGVTFYLYGFLWQAAGATLILALLYALAVRRQELVRCLALAGAVAGAVAAPAILFAWWVSGQAYFWESLNRYGLVETHLPVAEVIYSGGWVGLGLVVLGVLYWRIRDDRARTALVFLSIAGAGIWAVQGSNTVTGKLLEQGDHLRRLITLWVPLAAAAAGFYWMHYRVDMPRVHAAGLRLALAAMAFAGLQFVMHHSHPFREPQLLAEQWQTQQSYAPVLEWLETHEPEPKVVWSNPHSFLAIHIPALTRHYALYLEPGQLALLSSQEVEERYLVSSYFDTVDAAYLKKDVEQYVGRANAYHLPQTREREAFVCKLLHLGDTSSCPPALTAQELLGDEYFNGLAEKFNKDIRPNIKKYLDAYHVSYILKDKVRDVHYRPQELGGTLVYSDEHFELYKLQ